MLLSIFVYNATTPSSSFVKGTNYSITTGFLKCKQRTVFTGNRSSCPRCSVKKDVKILSNSQEFVKIHRKTPVPGSLLQ